ncbi:MAG: sugar transferase [Bacteroidetes bacterium]|nr:sugar transferase [Bacteroidota bacterium]
MGKRFFDLLFSLAGLIILLPFLLIFPVTPLLFCKGGPFYSQLRVGRYGKTFRLLKFRTMRPGSDLQGQLTVGGKDPRITSTGYFLRKYKLDELPQLINIIKGDMSLVGPRPEVPAYVALYTPEQRKVLSVRPGLTDYASLCYINENELLGKAADPEKTYIEEIMPHKLLMNMQYIDNQGMVKDFQILWQTIGNIISASRT